MKINEVRAVQMEKTEVKKKDLLLNAKYDIERMLSELMPI